jgi:hypothetical protein
MGEHRVLDRGLWGRFQGQLEAVELWPAHYAFPCCCRAAPPSLLLHPHFSRSPTPSFPTPPTAPTSLHCCTCMGFCIQPSHPCYLTCTFLPCIWLLQPCCPRYCNSTCFPLRKRYCVPLCSFPPFWHCCNYTTGQLCAAACFPITVSTTSWSVLGKVHTQWLPLSLHTLKQCRFFCIGKQFQTTFCSQLCGGMGEEVCNVSRRIEQGRQWCWNPHLTIVSLSFGPHLSLLWFISRFGKA